METGSILKAKMKRVRICLKAEDEDSKDLILKTKSTAVRMYPKNEVGDSKDPS
jgi:hypothetical protein